MIQIHLRVEDDLHRRINEAAHDERQSMNQFIADTMREKVEK